VAINPDNNYFYIVNDLKDKIRNARINASRVVNTHLLKLYWEIGHTILTEERSAGWGAKVVDKLAKDLRLEFSDMQGLSARNLRYMKNFASTYPDFQMLQGKSAKNQTTENEDSKILQDDLAKLSWYHHITLMEKVKDKPIREFYIRKTIENGWTRDSLVHQIESGLHKRQGALTHNFAKTIPPDESELTQQLFKDPYKFEFLGLGEEAKEKDLEQALINQIEKVLMELGEGFALYGRQHKLNAGDKEYFVDLVFYHTKLRRYVIIELKIGEFLPEYVGKMNLYLGLADDSLKGKYDEPTIGLILCKTKDKIVAEYALRDTSKPIGIAEYKISEMLPENIQGELPSIAEIEQKLDEGFEQSQKHVDVRLKTIKDRLRNIKSDELRFAANYPAMQTLFDKGLKPLYQQIIQKLFAELHEQFLTQSLSWTCDRKIVHGIEDVEAFWMQEENLRGLTKLDFDYTLHGLRKGGANHYNVSSNLRLIIDEYWYGFALDRGNQPFLKKLYHQPMIQQDIQMIEDLLLDNLLDKIEVIINDLEK